MKLNVVMTRGIEGFHGSAVIRIFLLGLVLNTN